MTATPARRSPWDFSDALELLRAPIGSVGTTALKFSPSRTATSPRPSSRLGDFGKVWRELGTSPDTSELETQSETQDFADAPVLSNSTAVKQRVKTIPNPNLPPAAPLRDETYASDGGCRQSAKKTVTWKDQSDPVQVTTDAPTSEDEPASGPSAELFRPGDDDDDVAGDLSEATLTKRQRKREKKQRQKEKKRLQLEAETPRVRRVFSDIESESEIKKLPRLTPASKASKHVISQSPAAASAVAMPESTAKAVALPGSTAKAASVSHVQVATDTSDSGTGGKQMKNISHKRGGSASLPSTPSKSAGFTRAAVLDNLRPTSVPQAANVTRAQDALRAQQSHSANGSPVHVPVTTAPKDPSSEFQILEKEERDLQLFLRLIHNFSEDKKWLTKPVPMANHNASPKGLHIFVDFSNIWIGFMDHLKTLQLRMRQRIPHQNISFDALVLLLERKRPVAKRVLAGSYPLLPAMELAKQIGYETLILEKVYKARELNERQRRMLAMQSRNTFAPIGTQGNSSSPELQSGAFTPTTLTNQFAFSTQIPVQPVPDPEKWVEQGVDEILHLKILESIVDSEEPSTMVVATGDAAKAEYSEGFMVMIRRALKKGWLVELVAFSKSISGEYWKRSFQEEWEGRFTILTLDQWAQYLLDT